MDRRSADLNIVGNESFLKMASGCFATFAVAAAAAAPTFRIEDGAYAGQRPRGG